MSAGRRKLDPEARSELQRRGIDALANLSTLERAIVRLLTSADPGERQIRALEGVEAALAHMHGRKLMGVRGEAATTAPVRVERAIRILEGVRLRIENPLEGFSGLDELEESVATRLREHWKARQADGTTAASLAADEDESDQADRIADVPPARWQAAIDAWRGELPIPTGRPKKGAPPYRWDVVVFELLTGRRDPDDAKTMRDELDRWRRSRIRPRKPQ